MAYAATAVTRMARQAKSEKSLIASAPNYVGLWYAGSMVLEVECGERRDLPKACWHLGDRGQETCHVVILSLLIRPRLAL